MDIHAIRESARRSCTSLPSTEPRTVRVFGSVARGEANAASDLDHLMEIEPSGACLVLAGFLWNSRIFGMSRGCRDGKET
jgi:predicted nucleotidyltransferase